MRPLSPTPSSRSLGPPAPLGPRLEDLARAPGVLDAAPHAVQGIAGLAWPALPSLAELSPDPDCKVCGHLWTGHEGGRCGHVFGVEAPDCVHKCGCDEPSPFGALPTPLGVSLAAVGAVAASMLILRR